MESANGDGTYYVVEKRVMVSGETLDTATSGFDQNNQPAVNFSLNAEGARKFGKVTGENIGRLLPLYLMDKLYLHRLFNLKFLVQAKLLVISLSLRRMNLL